MPRTVSAAERLVIGIPSIPRLHGCLEDTVRSVVAVLDELTTVVVLNAAGGPEGHPEVDRLREEHRMLIEGGQLEIIGQHGEATSSGDAAPVINDEHAAYTRWMVKQNLDVAFLMEACASRGDLYLHLEDDVIAADGWLAALREWKARHYADDSTWDMLWFYSPEPCADRAPVQMKRFFGAVGLLFRAADVPALARYIRAHSSDAPNDWLIRDYLFALDAKVYTHAPSLFQHIGVLSSFPWRVQLVESPTFREPWLRRQRRVAGEVLVLLRHRPRRVVALIAARLLRGGRRQKA